MTLDIEGKPEENCPNKSLENYNFESMPDEKFHRLMNMNDLSYSALFADKMFSEHCVNMKVKKFLMLEVFQVLRETFQWLLKSLFRVKINH